METKSIALADIQVDSTLNIREAIDDETTNRYMECFDQLPPVIVF